MKAPSGADAHKVMGFASDGTSAMVDDRAGAATFLAQNNPYLVKVHCVTHISGFGADSACASVELTIETDYVVWEVRPALSWWLSCLNFSPNDLNARHASSSLATRRVRSRPLVLEDFFSAGENIAGCIASLLTARLRWAGYTALKVHEFLDAGTSEVLCVVLVY